MATSAPLICSLDTDQAFVAQVSSHLGLQSMELEERDFGDGENKIRPLCSVRDRDVYLVQSIYSDAGLSVNDKLVRVLFLIGALRDASAGRITLVAPYICYSRKDRRAQLRDPVASRYVSQLLECMGINRVVTLDVHNEAAFQNSFRCPSETLHTQRLFVDHFSALLPPDRLCVASPDIGGVKRAESFRAQLSRFIGLAVGQAFVDKQRSNGQVRGEATVVGDVRGQDIILYDDMIASGTTVVRAAEALLSQGARSVHAAATHGVFAEEANSALASAPISSITVTDSVPPWRLVDEKARAKLTVLGVAPFIGDVVSRLNRSESLAELMDELNNAHRHSE
ncbi:MAG: ribose-phosphate pyrophosphokinase [Alteromonadaceae bacterium]|nr:ribose-phosphate pyrophosphokinase [Alteromonadaceae bacterium]|tara:strand:- start:1341 stop:2357 length:1017 start_codon:yes stop_codon:yes gene_type:complete